MVYNTTSHAGRSPKTGGPPHEVKGKFMNHDPQVRTTTGWLDAGSAEGSACAKIATAEIKVTQSGAPACRWSQPGAYLFKSSTFTASRAR